LSSKDHPTLIIGALQLVEHLLSKTPEEYWPAFRREGVHEVELLVDCALISSKKAKINDKEKGKDLSHTSSAPDLPPPPVSVSPAVASGIPSYKKLSSLSLDPEDAVLSGYGQCKVQQLTFTLCSTIASALSWR